MSRSPIRRAFLPSLEILLFLLIFWISLIFMPDMLNSDGDLGRHLTVGSYILSTRSLPMQNVFSHTLTGAPLILQEWLSEVLFALSYQIAGLNGVAWLTAGVIALSYLVLAAGLRLLGVSAPVAFLGAFAAYLAGMIHQLPRPHLFSLLLFTVFLILLELFRRRAVLGASAQNRYLIALLPLMLFWANLHGAFISGLVLVGMYAFGAVLERQFRAAASYVITLVLLLLVACINPVGAPLILHSFDYLQNRYLVDITVEYNSPNFHQLSAYPFAALIAGSLLLGARGRLRTGWTHALLLASWTLLALYSARNIPLYAQVAVLVLAPAAEAWLVERIPASAVRLKNLDAVARPLSGWATALIIVTLLILTESSGIPLDVRRSGNTFAANHFPVAAADALARDLPPGNMFNEFTWGGYLLYRLYPRAHVFIDGQTDFYGEALTREYLDIVNAQDNWQAKLDQYHVSWVILPPDRPLARELARSPLWRERYRDPTAVVWVRTK